MYVCVSHEQLPEHSYITMQNPSNPTLSQVCENDLPNQSTHNFIVRTLTCIHTLLVKRVDGSTTSKKCRSRPEKVDCMGEHEKTHVGIRGITIHWTGFCWFTNPRCSWCSPFANWADPSEVGHIRLQYKSLQHSQSHSTINALGQCLIIDGWPTSSIYWVNPSHNLWSMCLIMCP